MPRLLRPLAIRVPLARAPHVVALLVTTPFVPPLVSPFVAAPIASALAPALHAQAPATSRLTGVTLPAGTRASGNFLYRMAVRVSLQDAAKKAGGRLADAQTHEMFRLPQGQADLPGQLFALFASNGWTVGTPQSDDEDRFAWLEKDGRRILAYVATKPSDPWLYLGEGAAAAPPPVVATGPRTPPPTADPASLAVPQAPAGSVPPATTIATPPAAAPPAPQAAPGGARRFQFTTTNFDDGWIATDKSADGYVQVDKGPIAAMIGQRIPFDDAMRRDVRTWFWQREVASRWTVGATDDRSAELQYMQVDYREGAVTDASGKAQYVGMLVHKNTGGGAAIIVLAPDQATFRAEFPKPQDLERVINYNRFAVAPGDLVGRWSEGGSAYNNYVNANTGATVGMIGASVTALFEFAADGTYRSEHKGVAGLMGSNTQSVNQQEYRGRWQMHGNWQVTLTNRFRGASETFSVQSEVVEGGRILVLVNTQASGIRYILREVR